MRFLLLAKKYQAAEDTLDTCKGFEREHGMGVSVVSLVVDPVNTLIACQSAGSLSLFLLYCVAC